MNAKLRWKIANLLNRLPGQCWSGLASWAANGGVRGNRWPWKPIDDLCRRDAARCGECVCMKLRSPQPEEVSQ